MRVALLTGGDDPVYAVPLAVSLADQGTQVDFIGNDDMQGLRGLEHVNIRYLNLRGSQDPQAPARDKAARILRYYQNLIGYAAGTESRLFHILWLNKFEV